MLKEFVSTAIEQSVAKHENPVMTLILTSFALALTRFGFKVADVPP